MRLSLVKALGKVDLESGEFTFVRSKVTGWSCAHREPLSHLAAYGN